MSMAAGSSELWSCWQANRKLGREMMKKAFDDTLEDPKAGRQGESSTMA
jgi:hypothetical protein